jgi:hypothetical protein
MLSAPSSSQNAELIRMAIVNLAIEASDGFF